nr:alpha/beta hydrolase [Candidatus Sigynarchaeota archaeon]
MPVIVIAANEISYDTQGQGDRAILFIHGIGADRTVWKPLIEHFSKNYKCYRFDWKGFGESRLNIDSSFSCDILAKELKSIIDELNITTDFYIIADNAGALAAIQADIDDLVHSKAIIVINAADKFKMKAKYKQLLKSLADNSKMKMVDKVSMKEKLEKKQAYIETWLKEIGSVDLSGKAVYIETPVDFIIGKTNNFVSMKDCESTVSRVPKSRVVQIDAGDYIMLENPQALIQEIEDFITKYIPSLQKKT